MSAPCRSSMLACPPTFPLRAKDRARTLSRPHLASPTPLVTQTPRPTALNALARGRSRRPSLKRRNGPRPMSGTVPLLRTEPARAGRPLLELDLRPHLFQSGLDLLGLFLADAFLDRLRRAFDQVLRLLEAERGDGAHFL